MHSLLRAWGNGLYKVRWFVVAGWIVLTLFGAFGFSKLTPLLSGGGWEVPGSESLRAAQLMTTQFEGRSESGMTLVLRDPEFAVGTPEYNDKLRQMVDRLKTEEGITGVFSVLDASEAIRPVLVGKDNHLSIAMVDSDTELDYIVNKVPAYQERVVEQAESLGMEGALVGSAAFWGESSLQSQEGLAKAELIVFPLIIIILLLVFRSIMATVTPLIVTIASVLVAMGIIYLVAREVELSVFVTNSAMMLGLGVGIDYSLFIVSRFKQELEKRGDAGKTAAIVATLETAGHTVFFSAVTVVAALSALFIVPIPAIKAIAFGGLVVVIVAGLASLTLLPAVLIILGTRINKGTLPFLKPTARSAKSGWKKWTEAMMRRPALLLIAALASLTLLASPAVDIKLDAPDLRTLPEDTAVRQGFAMLEQSFGTGAGTPISLLLRNESADFGSPEAYGQLAALVAEIGRKEHVIGVSSVVSYFPGVEPAAVSGALLAPQGTLPADMQRMVNRFISLDRHTVLIDILLDKYGSSDDSRTFVRDLQNTVLPAAALPSGTETSLGGETVTGMDTSDAITDSLLPALGIMLVLIFIILVLTFRSLLLPLKAIVLNLFSVAATYGVLVFVFALGHGAELFNVETNGYIIHFVPILLLALLFGLSTDYEVFLVSRVKEEYGRSGDHEGAIAEGMERTGPLITGAAVLMIAVFAGFSLSGVLPIQMLGFGMAVAILLDATIIRMLLVPVTMKLLGKASWWFPGRSRGTGKVGTR